VRGPGRFGVRRQLLPDGAAVATALNGAGDVAWQELSGWVSGIGPDPENSGPRLRTEYGYDTMGRVVTQRMGVVPAPGAGLALADAALGTAAELDGPATSRWGHDLLGRVVSTENGHAQWTYEYDGASGGLRRIVQRFVDGGAEYATERTYRDNATRLGTLTYPGGLRLSYDYDLAGRVTGVTQSRAAGSVTGAGGTQPGPDAGSGQWAFEYDHAGRFSQLTAPNGTVTTYERDLDGAVLAQRTVREADGATVLLLERSFDSRGRTQFEGASWSDDTLSGMVGSADVLEVDGVGGHMHDASVRGNRVSGRQRCGCWDPEN
jgi:YD repeat-containing protein